jgi:hypothetical protein
VENASEQFHSSYFDVTGINPRSESDSQQARRHSGRQLQVAMSEMA